jgi:hypothetical protein
MADKTPPSLETKKDLILHTYDSFLVGQTRLFVQSRSNKAVGVMQKSTDGGKYSFWMTLQALQLLRVGSSN